MLIRIRRTKFPSCKKDVLVDSTRRHVGARPPCWRDLAVSRDASVGAEAPGIVVEYMGLPSGVLVAVSRMPP